MKKSNIDLQKIRAPFIDPNIKGESTNDLHPAFCFKLNTCKSYAVPSLEQKHKASLLIRLHELGKLDWKTIQTSPKQGMGHEKIPVTSLRKKINLPKELKEFLVFRFDDGRIIGYRDGQTFYISAIDTKYECYRH